VIGFYSLLVLSLTCSINVAVAAFEGFNATILAYGQTGSGKTFTMGSSSDMAMNEEAQGIIPRVIRNLFQLICAKEEEDPRSAYKIRVQFLEIYGEDIKDLLDQTRSSKVTIREMRNGEVFVTGAREEFVSSYEQMMKSLEDGSRNRTTAATKMNQTSSRSHAIFTVIIEQTILAEAGREESALELEQEVRKSKFHFVDLAGSERAKRTSAQGQQLREGIDINKGLLALGNVISALGDETKRGKVFVPYRDSKLTRMLQDSLGGNSKTLMICCVSPAAVNYNESLNALRYANRARNIKNKPVVNRDPSLVAIDELRATLKAVATELLEVRTRRQVVELDPRITNAVLMELAAVGAGAGAGHGGMKLFKPSCNPTPADNQGQMQSQAAVARTAAAPTTSTASKATAGSNAEAKKLQAALQQAKQQAADLQCRLNDADFEMKRQIEQLKLSKQRVAEMSEQVLFARSERDFFQMRWSEACPQDAQQLAEGGASAIVDEQKRFMVVVAKYLQEVDELKQQLALERASHHLPIEMESGGQDVDHEFTSAMTSLLAEARSHLQEECRKLQAAGTSSNAPGAAGGEDREGGNAGSEDEAGSKEGNVFAVDELELDKAFLKRQKLLSSEVTELGQSIELKEQLVAQLVKSAQQYSVMKAYYEQKLGHLSEEMASKQEERDRLAEELERVTSISSVERGLEETRLIEQLKAQDEELQAMKKRQDALKQLSQVQSTARYSQQLSKLQSDIVNMKRARVDLTKTLQVEKKHHLVALNEKVKEIDQLKRQLLKSHGEVRRLGRDKELAEHRVKDALREGAVLKRRASQENASAKFAPLSQPSSGDPPSIASAREALKAISKTATRWSNKRMLTETELKTKRWLDVRIAEISAREAAAEALRRQYEQQLELLARKERLEQEHQKALLLKASTSHCEDGSCSEVQLSSAEEETLLELIEDRLSSINGQLNVRNQRINDITQEMTEVGEVAGSSEKTLDALRKMAAGTLPASHELIRLLVDMLVHANKTIKIKGEQLLEQNEREKQVQHKLEDAQDEVNSLQHAHDKELTRLQHEYESKLQDLFVHVNSLHSVQQQQHTQAIAVPVPSAPSAIYRIKSFETSELHLAIALQENMLMKSQLQRENLKYAQIHIKYQELDKVKIALMRDLEDKNQQIRFLEEDRSLFKDLSDDLKAGLIALGKAGKHVVDTAKDRVASKRTSNGGLFGEYWSLSDEEDDTKSVLGEYKHLGEEIIRTGEIQASKDVPASVNIYDRLYNPSSYTGHMKTVFNKDIESRRKRTQQIRSQEKFSNRKDISVNTAAPALTNTILMQSKRSTDASSKFFAVENMEVPSSSTLDLAHDECLASISASPGSIMNTSTALGIDLPSPGCSVQRRRFTALAQPTQSLTKRWRRKSEGLLGSNSSGGEVRADNLVLILPPDPPSAIQHQMGSSWGVNANANSLLHSDGSTFKAKAVAAILEKKNRSPEHLVQAVSGSSSPSTSSVDAEDKQDRTLSATSAERL
jgi:hypothetical protein